MTVFNPNFNEGYDVGLFDIVRGQAENLFPNAPNLQDAYFTQAYYLMENGMPVPPDLAQTVEAEAENSSGPRIVTLSGVAYIGF